VQDKGDYIEVSTASGMIFKGDLIVGADGIHSTVRREMWRIANDVEPGYISTPSNEGIYPLQLLSIAS
jgi:2-polyprenyl-6-methoxyphenol hydroxylase-like FAD-dependent oxidoreductase